MLSVNGAESKANMLTDKIDEYRALLTWYHQGIYTNGEVVSKSLELLFESSNRDVLWNTFTSEHRHTMTQLLVEFDESAEPFAIRGDPIQAWREMSTLKRWLAER